MLLAAAGLPAYDAGKLNSNAGSGASGGGGGVTPTTSVASRPSAASALMKTLSVRLHRGTEFIKDTVQKALVISAPTSVVPVPAPAPASLTSAKLLDHSLKRKLSGAGGLMGCGPSSSSSIAANRHYVLARETHSQLQSQAQVQQPQSLVSQVPTLAFLRTYTVAPTALHRSAAARKRNPSTDSLLMDLCDFKPIRPMPITPIKINKFRGFELKKPKFVAATNLDSDEDEDEDDEVSSHKPKHSNLTLPTNEASAFVPMPYKETTNTNTAITNTTATTSSRRSRSHTSSTSQANANPSTTTNANPKPKRRRRAPLLTAKKQRKRAASSSPTPDETEEDEIPVTKLRTTAASGGSRRNRGSSTAASMPVAATNSPAMPRPPAKRKAASGGGGATKRSREASVVAPTPVVAKPSISPGTATGKKTAPKRKTAAAGKGPVAKRGRGATATPPRASPPMTRQRARQKISASN